MPIADRVFDLYKSVV